MNKENYEMHKEEWLNDTIEDNKCAYCGEDKMQNKNKHIDEMLDFLDKKFSELSKILSTAKNQGIKKIKIN